MRFSVNDQCISCGLCVNTCPEVFQFGEDGLAHVKEQPPQGELTAKALDALEGCPVDAIEKKD